MKISRYIIVEYNLYNNNLITKKNRLINNKFKFD